MVMPRKTSSDFSRVVLISFGGCPTSRRERSASGNPVVKAGRSRERPIWPVDIGRLRRDRKPLYRRFTVGATLVSPESPPQETRARQVSPLRDYFVLLCLNARF